MIVPFQQLELILAYKLLEEEYLSIKELDVPIKIKRKKITKNTMEKIQLMKEINKFSFLV